MGAVERIKQYCATFIHKVKLLLLNAKTRESLTFLFFLFIAALFRVVQMMDGKYQTEIELPLAIQRLPEQTIIVSEIPTSISVKIEQDGFAALRAVWSKKRDTIFVPFQIEHPLQGVCRISSAELLQLAQSVTDKQTRIMGLTPDTLALHYVQGAGKKVPVRLAGKIEAAPQYRIARTYFSPDSVLVYAKQETLDTMAAAYISPVQYTQLSDSMSIRTPLRAMRYVKTVPQEVTMSVVVDMYSEKTVEVPIIGANFPADKALRTFPARVSVTFQVGTSEYQQTTEEDFFISVTYEELLNLKGERLPISLKSAPSYIRNVRISPSTVDYMIEETKVKE